MPYDWQQRGGLGIGDDFGVHLATALEDAKDGNLASSTPAGLTFTRASKVTFIHFDLAVKAPFFFNLAGNNLAQAMVKPASRVAVYTNQIRCCSCGRANNKVFK